MPELSRSQIVVYAAIAIAAILLGARWLRSDPGAAQSAGSAEDGRPAEFSVERGGGEIVVHVAGAVRDPGVYRLAAGTRVADAVERAGGASQTAMPDAINLAANLADGQQVVVPARAAGGSPVGLPGNAGSEGPITPISVGTATVEQLETIEGIGPITAQDIVTYRDQHGGLSSIDDLDQIAGIGPTTMEALRDRLQP